MNNELPVKFKKLFRMWLGTNWPRIAVGSVILTLTFLGGICAWKAPHPFAFENSLFALAVTWVRQRSTCSVTSVRFPMH